MAVVAPWGARLGYLRASLAAVLAPRYAKGEVFFARVVEVKLTDSDPNEQLYIEVWSRVHGKDDLMLGRQEGERGDDLGLEKSRHLAGKVEGDRKTYREGVEGAHQSLFGDTYY